MAPRDLVIAVLVAIVWGLSFAAIRFGVNDIPPILLTGLRFAFTALPAVFFYARPACDWRLVVAFSMILCVIKFSVLFMAIRMGMPTGVASLVIQMQVFFTIAAAAVLFGERPSRLQGIGAGVAFAGIVLIGSGQSAAVPTGPLLMVLVSALCWASANQIAKRAGKVDMVAFIVWASLYAILPLMTLSALIEGTAPMRAVIAQPSPLAWASALFLAYGATFFGFSAWNRLLTRYPAATVTPFALLVPVVGLIGGVVIFGEAMPGTVAAGALLVLAGLALNIFSAHIARLLR